MSIALPVVEIIKDGIKGRGEYEFCSVPAIGDRIVIPSGMGELDIMRVLFVEHSPVSLPKSRLTEEKVPSITLYVEFLEEYSGG